MSKQISIGGTTYLLPSQNDSAPWGEDLSDLIEAMATVINSFSGVGDILETNFSIANNQVSAATVVGLSFDVGLVRSAIVQYSIYRSTDTNETGECGIMLLTYLTDANEWTIAQYSNDDSGVVFTVDVSGQVKYTSNNLSGTSYSGQMVFSASAFEQ